uniref:Uncharacterized protein n=1 Tax=Arundo donax TaxID=35708 RepID=A0A0A9FLZ5_ARUDO
MDHNATNRSIHLKGQILSKLEKGTPMSKLSQASEVQKNFKNICHWKESRTN